MADTNLPKVAPDDVDYLAEAIKQEKDRALSFLAGIRVSEYKPDASPIPAIDSRLHHS